MDLVAIEQMLGHWQVGTTMRYVSPRPRSSRTPIAERSQALGRATREDGDGHPMEAANDRRPARGMDRIPAAAAAGRAGRSAACRGVISALFTRPVPGELSTLAALCTALECTPYDLFEVDTTPVEQPAVPAKPQPAPAKAVSARGRSLPPV